jgi:hypothetical protein
MTAVQHAMTLQRLDDLGIFVEFINQHGDKLGPLTGIGVNSSYSQAQIFSFSRDTRPEDTAAAVITWFYLLDDARLDVSNSENTGQPGVHIEVDGTFRGRRLKAFCGIHGSQAADYLGSLSEVTVHSLRRIQIGDVPAVDTGAVAA